MQKFDSIIKFLPHLQESTYLNGGGGVKERRVSKITSCRKPWCKIQPLVINFAGIEFHRFSGGFQAAQAF